MATLIRKLGEFVFGGKGFLVLIAATLAGLFGLWQLDKRTYAARKVAAVKGQVEANNGNLNAAAAAAGAKSLTGSGGLRNPYYRQPD